MCVFLVSLLFLCAFIGSMVPHGTTGHRAEHRVMPGIMARDTSNHCAFDATL